MLVAGFIVCWLLSATVFQSEHYVESKWHNRNTLVGLEFGSYCYDKTSIWLIGLITDLVFKDWYMICW